MTTASELVANGCALLDEHNPGWDGHIDLDTLRLSTCAKCVLGQLYGTYAMGLKLLHLKTGEKHGFSIPGGFFGALSYDELDAAWADVIAARRVPAEVEELAAV